jgi:7-cyano-7-deazaguanine reductase
MNLTSSLPRPVAAEDLMETSYTDSPLGRPTEYPDRYTPSLLCPIPRWDGRESLDVDMGKPLPFRGVDIWNHYEVSWLDEHGKPVVALAEILVPAGSRFIIESKSMKLYFNSLNFEHFSHRSDFIARVEADLSQVVQAPVQVMLFMPENRAAFTVGDLPGECLDALPLVCKEFTPSPDRLKVRPDHIVSETLYSNLLRSNCPVTRQPDWASIMVRYRGPAIDHTGLLAYIVSYRNHADFHEHCVERIFMDILRRCEPMELTVYARYTRRGGLDINPFRTNTDDRPDNVRLFRQ